MKVVGCTISSWQGKVNIFQFNINLFATQGINYFNQQRDSSVTRGGMEAMPPRGNPSVVPRDYPYANAHSNRQCELTFQPVNPGTARTRVSAHFLVAHAGARGPRLYHCLEREMVLVSPFGALGCAGQLHVHSSEQLLLDFNL